MKPAKIVNGSVVCRYCGTHLGDIRPAFHPSRRDGREFDDPPVEADERMLVLAPEWIRDPDEPRLFRVKRGRPRTDAREGWFRLDIHLPDALRHPSGRYRRRSCLSVPPLTATRRNSWRVRTSHPSASV